MLPSSVIGNDDTSPSLPHAVGRVYVPAGHYFNIVTDNDAEDTSHAGVRVMRRLFEGLRARAVRRTWLRTYARDLARVLPQARARGLDVLQQPMYEQSSHPQGYIDFECRFAAWHLQRARPADVLDIGSYRHFVLGVSAFARVTSLDVRARTDDLATERLITGDARRLDLPDAAFDAVVTLSSVEHFGLGRYGDEIDLDADRLAVQEMRRVLRPGGLLIITTTLTTGRGALAFNTHRIYDLAQIHELMRGMTPLDERFFSHRLGRGCDAAAITAQLGAWDVYCGCWQAP